MMMKRSAKQKIWIKVLAWSLLAVMSPGAAFGISNDDLHAILNDTNFYSETDGGTSTCDGSVAASVGLPADTLQRINALKSVYEKAAQANDLPWQVLAAIHFREANNDPNLDLQAGNPFGGGSQFSTQGAQPDLATSADNAAKLLQQKAQQEGVFKKAITAADPDPELIKDALYSYNGRAQAYADQAAKLGFNPTTQPYEGSPYVMNLYDSKHQNMMLISHDNGPADTVDSRMGAFTVYIKLGGAAGGDCGGTADGNKIVQIAESQLGHGNDYGPPEDDKVWCADFVSWVYKQAGVPFTGGADGGWRIAAAVGVYAWMQHNGTAIDRASADLSKSDQQPQPGDVIYFNWKGGTGGGNDHIGIVIGVSGNLLKTINGNWGGKVAEQDYPDYATNTKIIGWGRRK